MTDYRGRGPIHISAINGDLKTVEFLLQQVESCNLDLMDHDGKTALYYACIRKHVKIAELLMAKGARVQVRPAKLVQVLNEAAFEGDLKMIELFAKAEVDLNQVNFDGRNLGHLAAAEGHEAIVRFLAHTKRYNFKVEDRWGKSALDIIKWSDKFGQPFKNSIQAYVNNKEINAP